MTEKSPGVDLNSELDSPKSKIETNFESYNGLSQSNSIEDTNGDPGSTSSHANHRLSNDYCYETMKDTAPVEDEPSSSSDGDDKDISLALGDHICPDDIEGVDLARFPNSKYTATKKQIIILSEAGKPIYCRYGKETDLVTICGVMQAFVSIITYAGDVLQTVKAGKNKYGFLNKHPIIIVAVSNGWETELQLHLHLIYIHHLIISMIASNQMEKIFESRRNFDFRRLMGDCGRLIDSLMDYIDKDPSIILGAIRCLPLSSSARESVAQTIIQSCSKVSNLVFAILIAESKLVSFVRMKCCSLEPIDLHILINLVNSSESFKSAEVWTPICLPKFNPDGYLHGHVSYLSEDCQACLLLLSNDRDDFFSLSNAKQKIVERLRKNNILPSLCEAIANHSYLPRDIDIFEIRHFMYKNVSNSQITAPEIDVPYHIDVERGLLMGKYLTLHNRLHSKTRPLKTIYHATNTDNIFGWVTPTFELYAAFEPLVTKTDAINAINKLLEWIRKREGKYFILSDPTF